MAFGRTPLIKLSPNKTVEGFLGGAFMTFIFTLTFIASIFHNKLLMCMNHKIDVLPFQPVTCTNAKTSVFEDLEFFFPVQAKLSPVLITCVFYGIFTSFVTPFAGFFASGMKRAYQLKDFSTTFPGHGGWLDRFDCWIFATIFMYGLLTRGLYKTDLVINDISTRYTELSSDQ